MYFVLKLQYKTHIVTLLEFFHFFFQKKKDKTASISHFEDNDVSSGVCGLNTTTDITFNISENNKSHSLL